MQWKVMLDASVRGSCAGVRGGGEGNVMPHDVCNAMRRSAMYAFCLRSLSACRSHSGRRYKTRAIQNKTNKINNPKTTKTNNKKQTQTNKQQT